MRLQTQELVRTGFGDRTILTIAHRLNTIIDNDRILLMDFGRVAECATNLTPHATLPPRFPSSDDSHPTERALACASRRYDSPKALLDDYDSSFSSLVRNTGDENEAKLRELAGARAPR